MHMGLNQTGHHILIPGVNDFGDVPFICVFVYEIIELPRRCDIRNLFTFHADVGFKCFRCRNNSSTSYNQIQHKIHPFRNI